MFFFLGSAPFFLIRSDFTEEVFPTAPEPPERQDGSELTLPSYNEIAETQNVRDELPQYDDLSKMEKVHR
jgi:hypothetical protein